MKKSIQGHSGGLPAEYPGFLKEIKSRIRTAQLRASLSANREMLALYWDIGRMIEERQSNEGWGTAVIPRLAQDVRNEFAEIKGFSERNLKRMTQFYGEYPDLFSIGPPPVAPLVAQSQPDEKGPPAVAQSKRTVQLSLPETVSTIVQRLVAQLPWAHNILLIQKIKNLPTRLWYMQKTIEQGWSRDILHLMIESRAHERQGKAVTNFKKILPPLQSDLATQVLKDPYIFDFMTLEKPFHERELETGLVRHLEKFLIELGQGFAFVGRQYHLDVGDEDFYIDLLFYHLRLRCFVVIELKKGPFKVEYAGKMNFYCNVVDDHLRQTTDQPTVGLILCQDKKHLVAEYALKGVNKAIGVSEYQLTRALPKELRSSLPSVAEIEKELMNQKPGKVEKKRKK